MRALVHALRSGCIVPGRVLSSDLRMSARCVSDGGQSYQYVVTDTIDAVTTIGINRPEKRNCVNPTVAAELTDALRRFEEDPNARVGVLYGKGGTFCAGFDLEWLSKADEAAPVPRGPMGPTQRPCSKPLLAAVDGHAVAGGLELALMCDLRIVEEMTVLGVFCRRFGVPLLDGGTVRLPALIGLSRALDLIVTGRAVSAAEAFQMGLANRLVTTGTALGHAVQMADGIAKFPQKCLLADRRSAYHAAFSAQSEQQALQFEYDNAVDIVRQEAIDGAKNFASGSGRHGKFNVNAKWKPSWQDT